MKMKTQPAIPLARTRPEERYRNARGTEEQTELFMLPVSSRAFCGKALVG